MCFLAKRLVYSSMFFVTLQLEYHNSDRFMAETKKIRTALVSVFHKDGLDELLAKLNDEGVKFLSTGGTRQFIEKLGYECGAVEDVTDYPSILGGRVKTLHPKVFGGILARRDNNADQAQMEQYGINPIDLVIVDLYPFEETVANGASEADIIEKIDIGGISLISWCQKLQRCGDSAQQKRVWNVARHSENQWCQHHSGTAQGICHTRFRR